MELSFLRGIRSDPLFNVFAPNVEVMCGRYRIDFADIHTLIGVEIDGHAYHSDKETFIRDRHRQRTLEIAGWRLIRFAAVEVMENVELCVAQFREWLTEVRKDARGGPITPAEGRAKQGGRARPVFPATRQIVELLDAVGAPTQITRSEAHELLNSNGRPVTTSRLHAALSFRRSRDGFSAVDHLEDPFS